ncbi:MAG: hypothetical protein JWM53_4356 [bacterium]|nr:hypothetical protein [bacterium]
MIQKDVRAKEAVSEGLRAVLAWPRVSLAALLTATVALLAVDAAWHRAGAALGVAARSGDLRLVGIAAGVFLFGSGFAALLGNVARTIALAAYSPAPSEASSPSSTASPSVVRRPFADGLRRTPAMITLQAIELTVGGMLAAGVFAALARHLPSQPEGRTALFSLLVLLPPAALLTAHVAATRVAMALAARGVRPANALVHAYDLLARRFPSLAGLSARLLWRTLPLTVPALAAALLSLGASPRVAVGLGLIRAVCLAAAALWSYASLAVWVGPDAEVVDVSDNAAG